MKQSSTSSRVVVPILVAMAGIAIVAAVINGRLTSAEQNESMALLCKTVHQGDLSSSNNWTFLIYMDVYACLACAEEMEVWRGVEQRLTSCGGSMYILTNANDSLDVTVAMELEGLMSPIQTITSDQINMLGWSEKATPIKVLCEPGGEVNEIMFGAPKGKKHSSQFLRKVVEKICGETV